MSVRFSPLLTAALVAALAASPSPVSAQSPGDRGKDKVAKLFRQSVSDAGESTVRIQCDGKDSALGTVVGENGLILTKGSELMRGGKLKGDTTCKLSDGTSYDAAFVGYHLPTDLALLRIDATGLKPVKIADSKSAVVGNWVAVPGTSDAVMAVGVVSVGVRKLTRPDEVVIENANKGVMGIGLNDPKDGEGVLVGEVKKPSAAARAGLRENDVICELAGKTVKNRAKLIELLEGYRPGDSVTVRVKRGEEELSLTVKLGTRADVDRGDFQNNMGGSLSGRRTGFPSVIQHDSIVRPMDCGGPLVDLDGNVLGINIARAGRVETWALPADVVSKALKELKSNKATVPVSEK